MGWDSTCIARGVSRVYWACVFGIRGMWSSRLMLV